MFSATTGTTSKYLYRQISDMYTLFFYILLFFFFLYKTGKAHPRVVCLSQDEKNIIWYKQGESGPSKASACIAVRDVTSVQPNLTTAKAKRAVEAAGKSNRCFSIIAASRSLDLECANVEERDVWMHCFSEFVQYARLETPEDMRKQSQQELDKIAQREEAQLQREERQKHRADLRKKYAQ